MKPKRINPGKRLRLQPGPDVLQRFLAFVAVDPLTGCWNWTGCTDSDGYPRFKIGGQADESHRVSYAVFVRTIPAGRDIDHRCRNRACVCPWHLRARKWEANRSDTDHSQRTERSC